MGSNEPRWSSDVHQADWIAPRLAPWEEYTITMAVPAGFEAYARVLHPAETPGNGDRLVRWADVATWSGMPLRKDVQFHSIALPPTAPGGPPPYSSQGPQEGSLYLPDAEVLAAILRDWTATPEDCWFCVWDGFGWDAPNTAAVLTGTGQPPKIIQEPGRGPVPGPVREGPRVHLPHRDYFLYHGPAEAVVALASLDGSGGSARTSGGPPTMPAWLPRKLPTSQIPEPGESPEVRIATGIAESR